jgi:hypothetical protein
MKFDYVASAELFMAKCKDGARQPLSYRRFATAAEAIRFAVEEFPTMPMHVAWMLVGDERFDSKEISSGTPSGLTPSGTGFSPRQSFYKNRGPTRASIMRWPRQQSPPRYFLRLTGLFGHGVVEPGEKLDARHSIYGPHRDRTGTVDRGYSSGGRRACEVLLRVPR